ncbi:unnamed protein product [Cuscuta epithymum]|uniref:Uncharacterized protein n=1 Tax=Cuscuta epithymum TaxID=186058 RepID=A0AAV0D8F4_9ASTE|nr:unnamed protein product [Cuscuta epithymum]CAH9148980.1 unnamed protein product [Cuscuta epithymum]
MEDMTMQFHRKYIRKYQVTCELRNHFCKVKNNGIYEDGWELMLDPPPLLNMYTYSYHTNRVHAFDLNTTSATGHYQIYSYKFIQKLVDVQFKLLFEDPSGH